MSGLRHCLPCAVLAGAALVSPCARGEVEIHFIRHGETAWNRAKTLQGSVAHVDLTEEGVAVARRTAEGLARAGVDYDRVYVSPYLRARHTAEIVCGTNAWPRVVEPRIREMCFGDYEGKPYGAGRWVDENIRRCFEEGEGYAPRGEGAESFADVDARVRDFLVREIAPLDGRVRRVLCVSHSMCLAGVMRVLGRDPRARVPNCGMHVVRLKDGHFSLVEEARSYAAPAFTLARLEATVRALESEIPALTATAEEAARRIWRNPRASIEVPREGQWGFSEELWERAGGLAQIANGAYETPDNVVLLSSAAPVPERTEGKLVVQFPKTSDDPRINVIADVVRGWMWCCEYAAAMTRTCGRFPATTRGLLMRDSWICNGGGWNWGNLPRLLPCSERIPAGRLARAYHAQAMAQLDWMAGEATQSAIRRSAEAIRRTLDAGHAVGIAGIGHPVIEECTRNLRSRMTGIAAAWDTRRAFNEALSPGDLLVWLSYNGLNTHWADYGAQIHGAGLDLVVSYVDWVPPPTNSYVKAFIPQHWSRTDAEVAIPVPPHAMAPVSEISRCTILRLLDEEVAKTHPRTGAEPKPWGCETLLKQNYPAKVAPPPGPVEWTSKGLTVAMSPDRRWALKGKTGFSYDMLRPLSGRLVAYERNRRYGLMDADGREITPADRDLIAPFGLYGMAERDYAVFAENGLYGKMDPETGAVRLPAVLHAYPERNSDEEELEEEKRR